MKRTICAWLLVLGLAVGTAVPASAAAFTDVASDAWYAQAVNEVSAAGIMNGTTTSTFSPDEQVTRGMVMAVLWRLAGSPAPSAPSTFPDVEDWYYYADAVAWARRLTSPAAWVTVPLAAATSSPGSSCPSSSTGTASTPARSWPTAFWTSITMWTASTPGPRRAWPTP